MDTIITKLKWMVFVLLGGGVALAAPVGVDIAQNPYVDRGTHFELPITADFPQGERVEISKNETKVTMRGWNDEYAISITPQFPNAGVTGKANRPLLSKRMEFKRGDVTAFVEPLNETDFDIDFMLAAKPTTNIFTYIIEGAEDFDFEYQPELTQEEIDQGAERPENVVGSYAVYHKTKANNCTNCGTALYGTGKIMHIYKPKAIDANGNEVWAVLDYANGLLSVEVPQNFLDGAVYPVRIDPTLGYTSSPATKVQDGNIRGSGFTTVEAGTMTSFSIYAACNNTFNPCNTGGTFGLAIYSDDGSSQPATYLSEDSGNAQAIQSKSQVSGTISYEFSSSVKYWLALWSNDSSSLYYDADTSGVGFRDLQTGWETWPVTAVPTGQNLTHKYGVYATYTASGAQSPTVRVQSNGVLKVQSNGVLKI